MSMHQDIDAPTTSTPDAAEPSDLAKYLEADDDVFSAWGTDTKDAAAAQSEEVSDDVEEASEVKASSDTAKPHEKPTAADVPPWVEQMLGAQQKAIDALTAQNERLEKLVSAPRAAEEPTKPAGPVDLMREAMALDDDDPDKQDLLRAASMAMLESEWEGDEATLGEVNKAKRYAKQQLSARKSHKTIAEELQETRQKLAAMERRSELRDGWSKLARGLPALADDERAAQAFPHARELFREPSGLEAYVMEVAAASDKDGREVFLDALGRLDGMLGDLDAKSPEEVRAVAKYAGIQGKHGLREVLTAYAKTLTTKNDPPETATDTKKPRKPTVPAGVAGGRVAPNKTSLEAYLDIDDMDAWSEHAQRAARARA